MDGGCTATFTGTMGGTYGIPCSDVDDFDDGLLYHGSRTFTIYTDVNHSGRSLYIQPECYPAYRESSSYNYVYIRPEEVSFNDRSIFFREYDLVLVFCLVLLCCFRGITIFRR